MLLREYQFNRKQNHPKLCKFIGIMFSFLILMLYFFSTGFIGLHPYSEHEDISSRGMICSRNAGFENIQLCTDQMLGVGQDATWEPMDQDGNSDSDYDWSLHMFCANLHSSQEKRLFVKTQILQVKMHNSDGQIVAFIEDSDGKKRS